MAVPMANGPPFATLNHVAADLGIPNESEPLRVGISCASNEKNRARHTWDRRSKDGRMGALTTIVVPWLVDRMDTTSWQAMAWWIHDKYRLARGTEADDLQLHRTAWL